ncbi:MULTISPECIES: Lrp/AsnC family transcriptional regulator [Halorussus]|uniref:Lrp/AsnC family transcriptional regulator n=1 Tax=Halorussus TaxID=1070314 RepID=UPI0020A192D2|nr:Lrp/AsnC family transcriptional regulator [Halorussus vallis]USZ76995.1 Lrp/AsnC family transcriptional regulator [Halorussus vallis]
MANEGGDTPDYSLDDVDRGILFALQRDARNSTAQEIADEVDVSASTVRNRIANLEETGVIEAYQPVINYENAGYQLRVMFVATARTDNRARLSADALAIRGVVDVREMMTSQRNLFIEVIAQNTHDLTAITEELNDLGLEIVSSEIMVSHHFQAFDDLEF